MGNIRSARTVRISTGAAFPVGATTHGPYTLADEGSETPDPEVATEGIGAGAQAAVGATVALVLRLLGVSPADLAILQGYADALTEVHVRVYSRNGDDYAQYGPGYVTRAVGKAPNTGANGARASTIVGFNAAGDTPQEILTFGTEA